MADVLISFFTWLSATPIWLQSIISIFLLIAISGIIFLIIELLRFILKKGGTIKLGNLEVKHKNRGGKEKEYIPVSMKVLKLMSDRSSFDTWVTKTEFIVIIDEQLRRTDHYLQLNLDLLRQDFIDSARKYYPDEVFWDSTAYKMFNLISSHFENRARSLLRRCMKDNHLISFNSTDWENYKAEKASMLIELCKKTFTETYARTLKPSVIEFLASAEKHYSEMENNFKAGFDDAKEISKKYFSEINANGKKIDDNYREIFGTEPFFPASKQFE